MNWIQIGTLDDIPRQGARTINTKRGEIALFRTVDDQFFAVDNRCPHKNGPLAQGIVHGHRVTCPLHAWNINLETGDVVAPDVGCTHRYALKIESGILFIELPEKNNG